MHTIDMERFAGLNIRGFSLIEVYMEILFCHFASARSTHFLVQLKGGIHIYGKTFMVLLKTEKRETLAQQIFPHLR